MRVKKLSLILLIVGYKEWEDITGISYIDSTTKFVANAPTPRMRDLAELPSPFMNGVFDELVENNPEENGLVCGKPPWVSFPMHFL